MRRSSLLLALALTLVACVSAADMTPAPVRGAACTESGGAKINLSGNFGFCYLVGQRMRKGSIYAQCKDGVLTCFADEGIPDKPQQSVPCIAPSPGLCGSSADATTAPTPTGSNATVANGAGAMDAVGHVRSADLGE